MNEKYYETLKVERMDDVYFLVNVQKITLKEVKGVQPGRLFPMLENNRSEMADLETVNQITGGGF